VDEVTSIQKVFTQEETRLYRARALIFELTPEWENIDVQLGAVPVIARNGVRIGTASLERDKNRVYADLVIDYATQDRFDLESGMELYAAPLVKFSQEVEVIRDSNMWMPTLVEIGNVRLVDRRIFRGMEPIGKVLV